MAKLRDATGTGAFEAARDAGGVVIADFYTKDCVICPRLDPMLAAAEATFEGKVDAFKLDAEEESALAAHYDIRGVPHLLLFHGGELVDRKSGFMTAGALRAWLRPLLGDG